MDSAPTLAAVNGPFENLALLHIIQSGVPPRRIAQVYRVQICAGSLVGATTLVTGLVGLWVMRTRTSGRPLKTRGIGFGS